MGKITGFIEIQREMPKRRPVDVRLHDYREIYTDFPDERLQQQGARCMDCGIPFCHKFCPLGNIIPEWNDLVYRNRWKEAITFLHSTNCFPEFTGRVCPAPCEEACTLNINRNPVTIKQIELGIVEHAWREGWIKPEPPSVRTGKKVAVIGSGASGLAASFQLNRAGHWVTLFERADRPGGILRYGIPDFKMEKWVLDRRVKQMEEEGVTFQCSTHVGVNYDTERLLKEFDAVLLTGGSTHPRDLNVPGRELKGIHFAMDFLPQQNRRAAGLPEIAEPILATGKRVVIIGGGDTGADCLGTCHRQGAAEVYQFELLAKPPEDRPPEYPWPFPPGPTVLRSSTSHEEGGRRDWSIDTTHFSGDEGGNVKQLHGVRLQWQPGADGRMQMQRMPGTEFELDCDLVLLAMGFLGPEKPGMLTDLGVELDQRGNVAVDSSFMSINKPGIFAAGDMRRGQSLVVWAIWEGREAARGVDKYLMGETQLPSSPE